MSVSTDRITLLHLLWYLSRLYIQSALIVTTTPVITGAIAPTENNGYNSSITRKMVLGDGPRTGLGALPYGL